MFNKPYSEETARTIDKEVQTIVETTYQRAKKLLKKKADMLEIVAQELLKKEIIFQSDLERLVGKRPFASAEPPVKQKRKPRQTKTNKTAAALASPKRSTKLDNGAKKDKKGTPAEAS